MSISNSEWLLKKILDCGTADFSILDSIDSEYLEEAEDWCLEKDDPSLSSIVEEVFRSEKEEFAAHVKEAIPHIKENLEAYVEFDDDGEKDLPEELEDIPVDYGYGYETPDFENGENYSTLAAKDLEILEKLDPETDISLYFNFQDSHIEILEHREMYSRLFKDALEQFEEHMGFSAR